MEEIMAMNWKCYDCNMTFTNPNLLQKHKSRFCVGGQLGDPDYLMLRKGFYEDRPRNDTEAPEEDHPRYNPNADPKVQQLAETHGRQMQYLSDRNKDLERQKEEIRRRLEELGKRPVKDDDSMNALLQELRAQEARNQRLLEELRRQLMDARHIPQADGKKPPFIYPVYYGNSLVAEITAMRQAYLQNGGNDPDILHQLAQMQAEAQAIDDSLRNRPAQGKSKRDPDNLHALELENERLKRQLLLLQEQNVAAKGRRKGDREDELERDIHRLQKDHLRKMYELQREIERLRQETYFIKMNDKPAQIFLHQSPRPAPVQLPQPAQAPAVQVQQPQYLEVDRLAPYDQTPREPYAHTWAKTHYRQDIHSDPFYDLYLFDVQPQR